MGKVLQRHCLNKFNLSKRRNYNETTDPLCAHANGVPSKVYQKLFDLLKDDYDIIFVSLLGPDKRYPIDNHWASLTQQVIDSIVQQAQGRKVIGLGHSLGLC